MIDEIIETAFPWGAWITLGAVVGSAFPRETRSAAKAVLRTGFKVADRARALSAEAMEKGQDVFAEARAEYEQLVREAEREAERKQLAVIQGGSRRVRPAARKTAKPRPRLHREPSATRKASAPAASVPISES